MYMYAYLCSHNHSRFHRDFPASVPPSLHVRLQKIKNPSTMDKFHSPSSVTCINMQMQEWVWDWNAHICMYVCIACICVCMVQVYQPASARVGATKWLFIYFQANMWRRFQLNICIHIYVYIYICIYVYMYICIYIHVYAYECVLIPTLSIRHWLSRQDVTPLQIRDSFMYKIYVCMNIFM